MPTRRRGLDSSVAAIPALFNCRRAMSAPAQTSTREVGVKSTFLGRRVLNDPVLSDRAYTVTNLRLSYAPDSDRWEAGVLVNNLTNTQYVLSAFDLSTTNGVVTRIYAPPRQVAGTFTYRFK